MHYKCQGLCLWPIKSISFLCDRHSKVLLILFFFFVCFLLMMPLHAFETFLLIIKLSKILMLEQYLEQC